MRKRLATTGDRGSLVRLYQETRGGVMRFVVQWGPKGARQQESFAGDKTGKAEAEAFFKGFAEELKAKPDIPALTTRALWAAYLTAESEHLRPNTRRLYAAAWRTWEQFIGETSIAEATSIQQIHEFRRKLDANGLATATVKDAIRNVRIVFNWAERSELIARNRWHLFIHKVSKEKRTKPRAEYRAEEFLKIWAAMDPTLRGQWRAWVAVGLLGIYGNRQHEILNLRWPWITDGRIDIDPSVVKTGEERSLRVFPLTASILAVAKRWAEAEGYAGEFVLFPGQAIGRTHPSQLEHYSIQSLTDAIHRGEERSGVESIRWRAGHGFRRGLVGDLVDETGDVTLALQAIGDRDLSMANSYRVRRNDKVDEAIEARADRLFGATEVQPSPENDKAAESGDPVTPTPATT